MHKRYLWKVRSREITLGERTLVMGVLNVTPDSFSDGGQTLDPDRAFARAVELENEGADLIDIGAESTRPGSARISEAEELTRLVPVLKRLRDKLSVPVSVDTYKAAVAERALELGADIINDPSGNLWDLSLARVVNKHDAGFIVNHMRGTPETWAKLAPLSDPMRSIAIDLEAALNRARQSGVERGQIVIDPGLGFGKRGDQNYEIIAQLQTLRSFDLPIAVGPSRKSFLRSASALRGTGASEVAATDPLDLEFSGAGAVAAAILNGAHIVRVHDVKRMRLVTLAVDAVRYVPVREEAPPEKTSRPRMPHADRRPQARWQRGQ